VQLVDEPAEITFTNQGFTMTASRQIKGLLAGVAAFAFIGTAMAQGNPPNPAVKSAPVGAGQQSTQKTPMGETGTQGAAAGAGSTSGSTSSSMGSTSSNMGSSSTGSTSSMGATGGTSGTSMGAGGSSADTSMESSTGTRKANRRMRADRN
jgi:hypothetical protein